MVLHRLVVSSESCLYSLLTLFVYCRSTRPIWSFKLRSEHWDMFKALPPIAKHSAALFGFLLLALCSMRRARLAGAYSTSDWLL